MSKETTNGTTNKYDVAIVGGGPAGVICAITVAQNGFKVAIVDKKSRDKIGDKTCGDAIDKAADRNEELSKEAWSDDEERKAYFNKRNAYYSNLHSDEIYATMSGAKVLQEPTKDMILYLRTSHFAFPEDGTNDEFKTLRSEFNEKVIHKNELIKGYYPGAHVYGADRTEFVEAFFFDSTADLDKMFDRNDELRNEAWPDEEARKERGKKAGKYFTGVHGDAIYTMVYGLSK